MRYDRQIVLPIPYGSAGPAELIPFSCLCIAEVYEPANSNRNAAYSQQKSSTPHSRSCAPDTPMSKSRAHERLNNRVLFQIKVVDHYSYFNGFGSYHESEALPGAIPVSTNSPQKPAYGLYAKKFSGTALTTPSTENQQSWLYLILPAAAHRFWEAVQPDQYHFSSLSGSDVQQIPNQLRWDPFDFDDSADWIRGLHLVAEAGDLVMKAGMAIFVFAAGKDMEANEAFYSADGDMLIVPQHGVLDIQTGFGMILVRANEICLFLVAFDVGSPSPRDPCADRGRICRGTALKHGGRKVSRPRTLAAA